MGIKRNGGLVFWHIGRLGGSIYLAKPVDECTSTDKAMARIRRKNARRELTMLRRWYARGMA